MNQDSEDLANYINRNCDGAFQRIVERHGSLVYGVAFRMTRNRALAQEITQSVFILLARKARSVRSEHLPGWLHQTTHWEVKNALRKEARGNRLNQQYQQHMDIAEHTAEQWNQVAPFLDDAVAKLPSAEKEVVLLRYFERLSFGEIAKATGKTEEACKKRAQRSLERLRSLLQRQGVHPSLPALAAMIGVYGLLPSPASAAEIARIATGAAAAAGTSATLGTSLLKTITVMTTKQLAAVAAVVCAIVTLSVVQLTKEHPSQNTAAATASPHRDHTAPVVKKTPKPVDWNRIDPDGKLPALMAFAGGDVPSPPELQSLSTEELLAALDEVTKQDGISKNTKMARRGAIIRILTERDPMRVLNRLEEDEARDFWFDLTPAYGALVKKDSNAADQWLKQQLDKGLLADTRFNESFERNCFESDLLKELQQTNPEAALQRILARENGSDRSWLLFELHDENFQAALSQSVDHYRASGDPLLFQDLMNSSTLEMTFSPSAPVPEETRNEVQRLVESIPDETIRNAALKRIEGAKQTQFEGVPLDLLLK